MTFDGLRGDTLAGLRFSSSFLTTHSEIDELLSITERTVALLASTAHTLAPTKTESAT